jgi:transposase
MWEATLKKKKKILREAFAIPLSLSDDTVKTLEQTSELLRQFWNLCISEFYRRIEWNKNLRAYNIMLILACPEGQNIHLRKTESLAYQPMVYWFTPFCESATVTGPHEEQIPLTDISVDLRREILRDIADSFVSWFEAMKRGDSETRPPSFAKEGYFQTLTWSAITNLVIVDGVITLPLGKGLRINIPVLSQRPFGQKHRRSTNYLEEKIGPRKITQIIVSKRKDGRFWLSAVVDKGEEPKQKNEGIMRAIDLGVGDTAVADSNGIQFLIPMRRPEKALISQGEKRYEAITRLEHELEHGVQGSKHQALRLKKFRKLHARAANTRDTFQRQLAHALVEPKVKTIVVGYTPVRLGLAQSIDGTAKQHSGVQNTGNMSRLLQYMKNKARERGVEIVIVQDPLRLGKLSEPESKLRAAQAMLCSEMEKRELSPPSSFVKKGFAFPQGGRS